jgi:Putative adhesin
VQTPQQVSRRRALTGPQKALLAVGGVAAFVLIGWGAWTLVNLIGQTSYQRELTLAVASGRLRVDLPGGIKIEPGSGPGVRVVETVRYGTFRPKLREEETADGLAVRADCPWFTANCAVDAVITVPANLSVDAVSSGGDITVHGLTGRVHLDSSGGGIDASGLTGPVVLSSSGGEITATRLTGPAELDSSGGGVRASELGSSEVTARSSGGDVQLAFDTPPDRVIADSSGGGVEVGLPQVEGGYQVRADSSGGETQTDVQTDPSSPRLIDAHSSGGDVRIVTASAG